MPLASRNHEFKFSRAEAHAASLDLKSVTEVDVSSSRERTRALSSERSSVPKKLSSACEGAKLSARASYVVR
jgi:hypothetical protein